MPIPILHQRFESTSLSYTIIKVLWLFDLSICVIVHRPRKVHAHRSYDFYISLNLFFFSVLFITHIRPTVTPALAHFRNFCISALRKSWLRFLMTITRRTRTTWTHYSFMAFCQNQYLVHQIHGPTNYKMLVVGFFCPQNSTLVSLLLVTVEFNSLCYGHSLADNRLETT